MSDIVIKIQDLTKYYGKVRGCENVNLQVEKGEIFGFLGPNGAGKSTTIRILLDFIRPTSGMAEIFGMDAQKESVEIKKRIGYVPTEVELYRNMTGGELLNYFEKIKGKKAVLKEDFIQRFGLDPKMKIRKYSTGNKQKVAVIQSFMHEPDLLILDEPTLGLDPILQQEFYKILIEFKEKGKTIFISSHILPEIEKIADRVGIIKNGHLVDVKNIDDLRKSVIRRVEVTFEDESGKDKLPLNSVSGFKCNGPECKFKVRGDINPILQSLAQTKVRDIIITYPNLEEVFFELYNHDDNA